ncbi:hypothetical protein CPAR01_07197, partial [Colletotrichum paranaense]
TNPSIHPSIIHLPVSPPPFSNCLCFKQPSTRPPTPLVPWHRKTSEL